MAKKRKTKEQKIIADLRRKLTSQAPVPKAESHRGELVEPASEIAVASPRLPAFRIPTVTTHESVKVLIQHDYSYLSGDLKKVGVLTGLAILIQGMLYLALR